MTDHHGPALHPHPQHAAAPVGTAGLLAGLWLAGTLSWWGIAFPPLVAPAPAWLATLQQVCFGTESSGVPKLYGWGALVAGPLGFAVLLAAGWGQELREGLATLWKRRGPRAVLAAACAILLIQLGWAGWKSWAGLASGTEVPDGVSAFESLPPGYPRLDLPLPEFALIDASGRVRTSADLAGRVALLGFAYGHCTTVCPATVATLRTAALRLADVRPRIVVVTLDAWRDTPSSLGALAGKWELPPDALLLSGRVDAVEGLLDALRVVRTRNPKTGEIDHAALTYVVGRNHRIAYAFNAPSPRWLEEAGRGVAGP